MTGFTLTAAALDEAGGSASLDAAFSVQEQPLFGANQGSYGEITSSAVGSMAGFRGYNGASTGIPASWPGLDVPPIPASVRYPVISIKPSMTVVGTAAGSSALAQYAAKARAGSFLTCWHEGEAAHNGFTVAQILALHAWAYPIVKKANPAVRYGQIFMTYTATSAGRHPITQWVAPGLDWYGLDGYMTQSTETTQSVFGPAFQQVLAGEPHARLAIAETNADQAPWRPAWFQGVYKLAQQNGCLLCFPFFWPANTAHSTAWVPSDTATVNELAAVNASSAS